MNASELATYIGQTGSIGYPDGLRFKVAVVDARERFGTLDFYVTPLGSLPGEPAAWVASHRVTLDEEPSRLPGPGATCAADLGEWEPRARRLTRARLNGRRP